MKAAFWAEAPAVELSQGDLIAGVWVGSQFHPRASLKRGPTQKGGATTWLEGTELAVGSDGFGHFLARGKESYALVTTESCEIDKKGGKVPILVAPVLDMNALGDEQFREVVRMRRRYAFFPLPAVEGHFNESYVDLRAMSFVHRPVLEGSTRVASATPEGVEQLAAHIVGFFTRVSMSELKAASNA